ncbi:MAG: cell division protein DivIVA [Actinomycetaceae bacterium]|nr:cell division protein DivIVA [Actinomycetaceae bacterium]
MGDTFARVGHFRSGYDVEQVEEFLALAKEAYASAGVDTNAEASSDEGEGNDEVETIDENTVRAIAFEFVRNGYEPELVDAALDRLEKAFIQRRRAHVVNTEGEKAWLEATYEQATTLYERLLRPDEQRFADAEGRGYLKADVDSLMTRIADYFDGKGELTSADIRRATFAKAKGEAAYAESVVDVYLDRVISVLLAVE